MASRLIADYALLSDCHSAALVSKDGSIDWLCAPAFDSPSVFGRLLDERAGHWSMGVRDAEKVVRHYMDGTMALQSTFETGSGSVELLEMLALGEHERGHDIGRGSPHCLLRSLSCMFGEVTIDLEFAPRPEYGLVEPLLSLCHGGVSVRGGPTQCFLSVPTPITLDKNMARSCFKLAAGETVFFSMQYGSAWDESLATWSQSKIERRCTDTLQAWKSWSNLHQTYRGPFQEMVAHSGRVLQALTYYPSGAIVAAPTTSLPESVGGRSQLGLSLYLGTRCEFYLGGALGCGLSRGGAQVLGFFGAGGTHPAAPGRRSSDHVWLAWRA